MSILQVHRDGNLLERKDGHDTRNGGAQVMSLVPLHLLSLLHLLILRPLGEGWGEKA